MDHLRVGYARLFARSLSSASAHASPLTFIHLLHRIATDASRILKNQVSYLWPAVIDVGESAASDGKVPPPTSIAAFREKVKTLHFSNGADKPVVAGLYEKMLRAALGGSTELSFMQAGWGDAEAVAFAESLPLCTRLEKLDLRYNKIGNEGLTALARALADGAAPKLEKLNVNYNKIGNEGLTALARALADGAAPELDELNLSGNDFSGADEGLRLLGQAKLPALEKLELNRCNFNLAALAEGMQAGAWPSLEELQMRSNEQASDEGAEALARALERGAMPKLKQIYAGGTVSEAGKAAIEKARPGVEWF